MKLLGALFAFIAAMASQQAPSVEPASLVLRNGKIVTVDDEVPEAQAIAIRGDRIAAVGSNAEHPALHRAATQVIDLARPAGDSRDSSRATATSWALASRR